MAETIFSSPIVIEVLLPFLLVFTVIFAILQKSGILGKGKKQIDAIVSLAIALIFVAVGKSVGIILELIPFLVVSLVIILIFLLLVGSLFKEGEFGLPKGVKITIGIIITIALVVAVIYATNAWSFILGLFSGEGSAIVTNLIFGAVIIGAIVAVVFGAKGGSSDN